ncbi:NAD+ synthetase [Mycoplasmopsis californica]|uniref:NH(3)-dependent NAD(+) synthetase n=1 Tax=Mycoplasmopsis equigenitalium TaxID=114883 RepID=A0ABY5J1I6_9BACT|nr:NAD(+) synthase [Mycoplasmopsis equigenitalium]UUD37122.1 NAD(+) synthase [Mycoplasmopsis equigenitalium]VEU69572.1 NAD+ synthetase [Mycoplasmopsis californica]
MKVNSKSTTRLLDTNLQLHPMTMEYAKKYIDYLVNWMQEKVQSSNSKGVVIGISGGIDSALTLALAKLAFKNNIKAISMPINSLNKTHGNDINLLSKKFNISIENIDLSLEYNNLLLNLKLTNNAAKINIMPRLRMMILYAIAQENNYLVCGTDNYDEWYTGYFTKHGDGAADMFPLGNLLKSEVRLLAKYLEVPDSIINKKPSADLWNSQTDEEEMQISYKKLDLYLMDEKTNLSENEINRIKYLHNISEHKRQMAHRPKTIFEVINKKG